ncbi:hypothetical protein J2S74_003070 [Evansella vedderi]|uniref:YfhD family protein n=1 Tax=Evansella vedderi TaxID=38282 RepID=A0ABT9ZWU0_9BACI|nr:hypothetical protein [Evansella vedderi]MDQ0255688.1 hypothetical protein [Evansella vedderi]
MAHKERDFINNDTEKQTSEINNPDISLGNMDSEFAYEVHAEDLAKRSVRNIRNNQELNTDNF